MLKYYNTRNRPVYVPTLLLSHRVIQVTPIGQAQAIGDFMQRTGLTSTTVKCFFYGLILFGGAFFVIIFLVHYLTSFGLTLGPIHHLNEYRGFLYGDIIRSAIVGLIASAVFLRRRRVKANREN
jgi:hypothetical protein